MSVGRYVKMKRHFFHQVVGTQRECSGKKRIENI